MKKKSYKFQDISFFLILAAIVVLANFVFSSYFVRLDLTEDKRYSISDASKSIMKNLKSTVMVEVFLEGEFPAGFQRLQKTIRETLDEFRSYSGNKIEYRFTNPSAIPDPKTRNEEYDKLAKSGLQPTNLMVKEGAEQVQKIIFPGALVRVKSKEIPVLFLKGNQASSPQERLNQSVEGVEFELANAIKTASVEAPKRLAILSGHGEMVNKNFQDLGETLKQYYAIEQVDLTKTENLDGFDAILVAKPKQAFAEFEKFKIDQFIVKGGKAIFFLDGIKAELDSIKPDGNLAFPYPLNLEDLFQKLGFRLNPDLLLDMNSGAIPLVVGFLGDKPQTRLVPWRFYPVLNDFGKHPVVKNMDALYGRFISTIDTFLSPHIRKTPLVFSSRYSRILTSPVRLSFNEARLNPQPEQYKLSRIPIAYLLEGKFTSLYENRMVPESSSQLNFKVADKPSKVIVVGDGDFVKNDTTKTGEIFGLGYDRYMRTTFANKDLIINALSYLLDENGAILARSKTIALRPLDVPRINKEKTYWQALNLGVPVFTIVLLGLLRLFLRNRKYKTA
jgi:gliding-associated putative ABC transporter substrate-binding component GldG